MFPKFIEEFCFPGQMFKCEYNAARFMMDPQ